MGSRIGNCASFAKAISTLPTLAALLVNRNVARPAPADSHFKPLPRFADDFGNCASKLAYHPKTPIGHFWHHFFGTYCLVKIHKFGRILRKTFSLDTIWQNLVNFACFVGCQVLWQVCCSSGIFAENPMCKVRFFLQPFCVKILKRQIHVSMDRMANSSFLNRHPRSCRQLPL